MNVFWIYKISINRFITIPQISLAFLEITTEKHFAYIPFTFYPFYIHIEFYINSFFKFQWHKKHAFSLENFLYIV